MTEAQDGESSGALVVAEDAVPEEGPVLSPTLVNIDALPIKKTLMIVNHFVINTTDFLNKFANICERKLNKTSQNIQRLEVTMALLEAKLDSIPWLGPGGGGEAAPAAAPPSGVPPPPGPPGPPGPPPPPGPPGSAGPGAPAAPAEAAPSPAQVEGPKLKDDIRFKKFFTMLRMGVDRRQIVGLMAAQGIDASIIDMDPDGPTIHGGEPAQSSALVVVDASSSECSESEEYD